MLKSQKLINQASNFIKNKNLISILILIFFVAIVILYHVFGYIGHYGYDDMQYANLATNILQGNIDYADHFIYRTPVILLTTLSYCFFGINDFASSLPAILTTIAILVCIFFVLKEKGLLTLTIGLALTTLSNWLIFYSDKLMPDIYVAFFIVLSICILNKYKYNTTKNRPFLYAFLFVGALFFGFLSKGTIILTLPLLLYYFIADMLLKRDIKFWCYSTFWGAVILAGYFFVIWYLTGDFTKRFDAIASNSYLNLCSYDQQSLTILLKRIGIDFFNMMLHHGMLTSCIFVIAFLLCKNTIKYFKLEDSFSFFLISTLLLLLSSNFMTISFSSYSPMCLDPRHYLFLIPVAAIPASLIITDFIREKKHAWQIIGFLFLAFAIAWFTDSNSCWELYLPLLGLFFAYYFLKNNRLVTCLFMVFFIVILSIIPFKMISYAQKVDYWKQREIVFEHIINQQDDCYVITDKVQTRLADYYNGFKQESKLNLLPFDEFDINSLDSNKKKILFLNNYTCNLSNYDFNDLPYYAQVIDHSNVLLFEDKKLNISVYQMNKLSEPNYSGTVLFQTSNDFETEKPFWAVNSADVVDNEKGKINSIIEYSATFSFPMDSLLAVTKNDLLVSCNLQCYFEDKTDAILVVSLEDENGSYIWKGLGVNKYIKAYSNWCPIKYNVIIPHNELKINSVLKIYLWNQNKKKAYIDDFEMKIISLSE